MAHSRKVDEYDVSTGTNLFWDAAKFGAKVIGRNLVGSDKSPRLEGPGSPEQLLTPVERKRGEPPFKSLVKEPERSVTSTATPDQIRRWGQEAALNRQRSESGLSAGVNAADVSMNNPRMWKDEFGHLWNPKTGKQLPHPTSHSHDVSTTNPPGY
jgi:hypothetical protein